VSDDSNSILKSFGFYALKYPSVFAFVSFGFGFFYPIIGAFLIGLSLWLGFKVKNKGLIIWCLIPFLFGLYTQQHKQTSQLIWDDLRKEPNFSKVQIKWDQDPRYEEEVMKGWAVVSPLDQGRLLKGLSQRYWVTAELEEGKPEGLILKGTIYQAWTLFKESKSSFPSMKVILLSGTQQKPFWVKFRYALIEPLLDNWVMNHAESGFIFSLLTGNRNFIELQTKNDFDRLGIMALLALSGLHVGIVFNLLRFISPLGKFHPITLTACSIIVLVYTCLAAWPLSMVRAMMMLMFYLLSLWLGRRSVTLNGLFLLGLFEWIRNPEVIYRLDFQLSYLGVLGILWFLSLLPIFKKGFHFSILKVYMISWGAMIWTWPIIYFNFGKVPTLSWWLAPPLFTAFGILVAYALFMGLVSWSGIGVFELLWKPVDYALQLFSLFSRESAWITPWDYKSTEWLYVYYISLMLICFSYSQLKGSEEKEEVII